MKVKFNEEIKYKELCQMLGEQEVTGGTNRDKQLARLNKTYVVDKVGRGKYVIQRQRTEEEIKLNSDRKNYSNYVQAMLLNMIAENPNIEMTLTYRQIREHLMMINSKYFPVKYGKDKIHYDVPYNYAHDEENKPVQYLEKDWIEISDQHDNAVIKYALQCLVNKGLLVSVLKTYIFYNIKEGEYSSPSEATNEQLAEIRQRQLEYLKVNIPPEKIRIIKNKIDKNEGLIKDKDSDSKYYGYLVQSLYSSSVNVIEGYHKVLENYIKELGYNRYANAFKIVRPTRLKTISGYFAPMFNEKQVERYLANKRFEVIPMFFHHQIVDKLIKHNIN